MMKERWLNKQAMLLYSFADNLSIILELNRNSINIAAERYISIITSIATREDFQNTTTLQERKTQKLFKADIKSGIHVHNIIIDCHMTRSRADSIKL